MHIRMGARGVVQSPERPASQHAMPTLSIPDSKVHSTGSVASMSLESPSPSVSSSSIASLRLSVLPDGGPVTAVTVDVRVGGSQLDRSIRSLVRMLRSKMGGARPTAVRIKDHLFLPSERAVKLSDLEIERGTKVAIELLFPGKPGTGVSRPFKGTPFASKMAALDEEDAARIRAGVADLVATERSAGGLVSSTMPVSPTAASECSEPAGIAERPNASMRGEGWQGFLNPMASEKVRGLGLASPGRPASRGARVVGAMGGGDLQRFGGTLDQGFRGAKGRGGLRRANSERVPDTLGQQPPHAGAQAAAGLTGMGISGHFGFRAAGAGSAPGHPRPLATAASTRAMAGLGARTMSADLRRLQPPPQAHAACPTLDRAGAATGGAGNRAAGGGGTLPPRAPSSSRSGRSQSSSFHEGGLSTPPVVIPVAPPSPRKATPEKELVLGLSLTPMVMDDPVTGIWTIIQRAAAQAGHALQQNPSASIRCAGRRIPLPASSSPSASKSLRQLGLVPGAAQIVVIV